jgi:hypothetical protein
MLRLESTCGVTSGLGLVNAHPAPVKQKSLKTPASNPDAKA